MLNVVGDCRPPQPTLFDSPCFPANCELTNRRSIDPLFLFSLSHQCGRIVTATTVPDQKVITAISNRGFESIPVRNSPAESTQYQGASIFMPLLGEACCNCGVPCWIASE